MNAIYLIALSLALALGSLNTAAQNTGSPNSGPTSQTKAIGKVTSQDKLARQQKQLCLVVELRAKRTNGAISEKESGRLARLEKRLGLNRGSVVQARGPGRGFGWRNGTGPRAQMGLCPLMNTPAAVNAPISVNRGPGMGPGFGGGRGWGRGGGWGLQNGTGPRAQYGLCPLVNSPQK